MLGTILALAVMQSAAQPTTPPPLMGDSWTLLCEGRQSVGLSWETGRWREAEFTPERFVLTKKPENDCFDEPRGGEHDRPRFMSRHACLNLRKVGRPYLAAISDHCTEIYSWRGTEWETTILCRGTWINGSFAPGGLFELVTLSGDTSPLSLDGSQASNVVQVGACSRID